MEELLKWWPLIAFGLAVTVAIGTQREKIKQIESKISELFRLWNNKR